MHYVRHLDVHLLDVPLLGPTLSLSMSQDDRDIVLVEKIEHVAKCLRWNINTDTWCAVDTLWIIV